MKGWLLGALIILPTMSAPAFALDIVNVSAPPIRCVFSPAAPCRVSGTDSTGVIPVIGGRLQTRTYRGESGSAASGLMGYEYRVDLSDAVGITAIDCIDRMTIKFGPVRAVDFNGDGRRDQVFVINRGGLGSIGLAAADLVADTITFRFSQPVCQGASRGRGASSYFFGLVSSRQPVSVTATVRSTLTGATLSVSARSPLR